MGMAIWLILFILFVLKFLTILFRILGQVGTSHSSWCIGTSPVWRWAEDCGAGRTRGWVLHYLRGKGFAFDTFRSCREKTKRLILNYTLSFKEYLTVLFTNCLSSWNAVIWFSVRPPHFKCVWVRNLGGLSMNSPILACWSYFPLCKLNKHHLC